MSEDKSTWLSSHELARQLLAHRNNDAAVNADGIRVPVERAYYDSTNDQMVIELAADSDDYKIAFAENAVAREEMQLDAAMRVVRAPSEDGTT